MHSSLVLPLPSLADHIATFDQSYTCEGETVHDLAGELVPAYLDALLVAGPLGQETLTVCADALTKVDVGHHEDILADLAWTTVYCLRYGSLDDHSWIGGPLQERIDRAVHDHVITAREAVLLWRWVADVTCAHMTDAAVILPFWEGQLPSMRVAVAAAVLILQSFDEPRVVLESYGVWAKSWFYGF